jgi:electron transfer flavoprotein-quinone oxidoreductase
MSSKSETKPWIPVCPADCFTLLTPKGKFASFRGLYQLNLVLGGKGVGSRRRAVAQTLEDISEGKVGFDPKSCVSCGTCGAVGPQQMVSFDHGLDGGGVKYHFG